jgi:hypothetical protein
MPRLAQIMGLEPSGDYSFAENDLVVTRESEDMPWRTLSEPHKVVAVEEVPCTCGQGDIAHGYHSSRCMITEAGHHQWVTVMVKGKRSRYSGVLLEPAPPP